MKTAIAEAHPNIALIKYWGKRDVYLNLPAVPSLSLTLGPWRSRTEVTWDAPADRVVLDGREGGTAATRALAFLDRLDPRRPRVEIRSDNDFPTGAGLASSAAGFAALALAASEASGNSMDPTQLSVLARQGSGSACRSLWGGFVQWNLGSSPGGQDCHGAPIAAADHWDVRMVVAIVDEGPKTIGSTAGMERSRQTSPLYEAWVDRAPAIVDAAADAVLSRDLDRLGPLMEQSTFEMHATMQTATPPLLYWRPQTVAVLSAVFALREAGLSAWATMDAGPQVKVLCEAADANRVSQALTPLANRVVTLTPGGPAHLVEA